MSRSAHCRPGERGLVLFTVLLILTLLIVVGAGARVMLQNDYRILANLRGSTEAFYIAEAGIEWSKMELARSLTHPPSLTDRSQMFSTGHFSVTFNAPAAVTPLVAKVDVQSAGTAQMANQSIRAQLTKVYDLTDGAVALRGNGAQVKLLGDAYLISGKDHDPVSGNSITGSRSRHAISAAGDPLRQIVESAVGGGSSAQIVAEPPDALPIAQTGFIPGSALEELAEQLCSAPQAILTAVPAEGTLDIENQTWGGRASPQLRCIDGLAAPGDAVQLVGVSGAGILVVRNATVVVHGSFHWEGWLIVTGHNVGFKAAGPAEKQILGALMVNETGSPVSGVSILEIEGAFKLLFSRIALHQTAGLIPPLSLSNLYGSLPFQIVQNFWRAVNP